MTTPMCIKLHKPDFIWIINAKYHSELVFSIFIRKLCDNTKKKFWSGTAEAQIFLGGQKYRMLFLLTLIGMSYESKKNAHL